MAPPRRRMIKRANKYQMAKSAARANRAKMARQPFNQRVTSAIQRAQETKFKIDAPYNYNTGQTLEDFVQFSTAITGTGEIYGLVPKISTGDDDYQRIGNQIQPTKLTVKVQCALGGTVSTRIYADFWFLHSKGIKDPKNTGSVAIQELMNDGQGLNIPYDGTSYTVMMPINKANFTLIKHVRILLKKGSGDNNALYSGGSGSAVESSPSFKSFDVTIPLPKKLTYENKNDYTCTNSFPFMVVGFYAADQFGEASLLSSPVFVQAQSQLYYKDA